MFFHISLHPCALVKVSLALEGISLGQTYTQPTGEKEVTYRLHTIIRPHQPPSSGIITEITQNQHTK